MPEINTLKSFWLLKTEPEEFSFQDLKDKKKAAWDGVRNFQARNFLLKMKKGDLAFIYHTGKRKEIVGLAQISKEAHPEPKNPDWFQVEIMPFDDLKKPITLETIKKDPTLKNIPLIRQSRLSVMPVTPAEFEHLLEISGTKNPV